MNLPMPFPEAPLVPEPADVPFPGTIKLEVDATDVARRIFRARETIPVNQTGPMTLLFPEWLPGYHAPQAPIELFAGLRIWARGKELRWKRHPVNVHAFHVDVPLGTTTLDLEFQFLSPTAPGQGRVVVGEKLLDLQWNTLVLYPAGHFARQIRVEASLKLPQDWEFACALDVADGADGDRSLIRFHPVPLDVLVDSPLFAGLHYRRVPLDPQGDVHLNLFADAPDLLAATPAQIEPHRALIAEADALFGTRHFDRYEILFGLSDDLGSIGVEHHRSCEAVSIPGYFTEWDKSVSRRDTIAHEYVHSWNGKHRRGADSWTPSFDRPIRNSLMWVYEGQTQYWDRVLCARSGLWSRDDALQAIALTAATHEVRAGSRWRPMSDTTRDPIIAARSPLPWASWQRSEDYYSEGALVWLDIDTRIRDLSGDMRSLDDFAHVFFGGADGDWTTRTYCFEDVVVTLEQLAAFDWEGFLIGKLEGTQEGAPLAGLERGGYRLTYRDVPSAYWSSTEAVSGVANMTFSLGVSVAQSGQLEEVLWEGPAYRAGLTAGSQLCEVNGAQFSVEHLKRAIAAGKDGAPVSLLIRNGKHERRVTIDCPTGLRYPHLEPIAGQRRLDAILAPRRHGRSGGLAS